VSRKLREPEHRKTEICSYCGKTGHGVRAPGHVRRSICPAYGHVCTLCNRNHHMESVCRSKEKPKLSRNNNTTTASIVFDTLCSIDNTVQACGSFCTDTGFERAIQIGHHVLDKLSYTWVKKRSAP